METPRPLRYSDHLQLSWGKLFFVCAGLIAVYDIAYLVVLLRYMLKAGVRFI